MPKLRTLRTVGPEFLDSKNSGQMTQELPCSAEAAFDALKDPACWKAFLGVDVVWTSDEPFGIGTTRTVTGNGQTIEEVFHAWEEGLLMGFHFSRTTLPLAAFGEEWKVVPRGDRSELQWRYAYEWGGPLEPLLGRAFGAFFAWNGRRSLPKLSSYLESA